VTEHWHDRDPTDVLDLLEATASAGLSEAEAVRRRERDGANELPPPVRRSLVLRALDQVREPMSVLLLVAALVSGTVLGEPVDAVAIAAIVVINLVIALAQEGRATRALEALEELTAPETTVRRDGRPVRVPARDLVVGDVLLVQAGDRIAADARLLEANDLEVDESMLTGESLPVVKGVATVPDPDASVADRTDLVFWGTFVTRGTATAVVVATGAGTEVGRLAGRLGQVRTPTPLQRELAALSRRLGVAAIAIAVGVLGLTLLRLGLTVEGLEHAFLAAVALAVAAVPEGLPTVTLIALAAGVRRMAARGAIVRRLPAVETLGAATVIVTDKTGTITENRMVVASVVGSDGVPRPVQDLTGRLRAAVTEVAVGCNDATLDPPTGDPMERALLRVADPASSAVTRARESRVGGFPLDARMRMSTVHAVDGGLRILVKGAPEAVLERCARLLGPGGTAVVLDADERDTLHDRAAELAAVGSRVLALASRAADRTPASTDDAERDLVFVALVGLRDPVRPQAAAAVAEARRAGVQVLMATGDHPATAQAIAAEVRLPGAHEVRSGRDVRRDGLPVDPSAVGIYARVDPDQKLDLVAALQARGEVVAMTGDGVNDAPALRAADIGVALGARGSDVAKEAADVVITDDDLATIVAATREGRGIYDNVRKVVDYLVAANLSEITVVVGALLLLPGLGTPLLPLQLLWINLVTDGLPALALGVDRHDPGLMDRRPRPRTVQLLGGDRLRRLAVRGALLGASSLAAGAYALLVLDREPGEARTVLLTALVVSQLLYAFLARQPATASWRDPVAVAGWVGTPALLGGVAGGLVLHLVIVWWGPAQRVFRTTALGVTDLTVVLAAAVVGLLAAALHRRAVGGSQASQD
jgi:P-type Ca2+ transporter type 2C